MLAGARGVRLGGGLQRLGKVVDHPERVRHERFVDDQHLSARHPPQLVEPGCLVGPVVHREGAHRGVERVRRERQVLGDTLHRGVRVTWRCAASPRRAPTRPPSGRPAVVAGARADVQHGLGKTERSVDLRDPGRLGHPLRRVALADPVVDGFGGHHLTVRGRAVRSGLPVVSGHGSLRLPVSHLRIHLRGGTTDGPLLGSREPAPTGTTTR